MSHQWYISTLLAVKASEKAGFFAIIYRPVKSKPRVRKGPGLRHNLRKVSGNLQTIFRPDLISRFWEMANFKFFVVSP